MLLLPGSRGSPSTRTGLRPGSAGPAITHHRDTAAEPLRRITEQGAAHHRATRRSNREEVIAGRASADRRGRIGFAGLISPHDLCLDPVHDLVNPFTPGGEFLLVVAEGGEDVLDLVLAELA
jgi:hypothetical protein